MNYGLGKREQDRLDRESKEKIGDESVIYQSASGRNINRIITKPEQKDIISRAKMNPEFAKYVQGFMKAKPVSVIVDGERTTQFIDDYGKQITDQDLLQAFLRWQTEGSPNQSYPNNQNPGQNSEPWQFNPNTNSGQQAEPSDQNKAVDDFFN